MAKRFIDTDIFKKRFVKTLQAPYKLLWLYILQDCNHAGIWEVDIDVAQIRTGEEFEISECERVFDEKIIVLDGGSKWFIPSFIEFQYGELSEKNRAHAGVISLLNKFCLLDEKLKIKPLTSPLQGAKEMEMEMEEEKENTFNISNGVGTGNFAKIEKWIEELKTTDYKFHEMLMVKLPTLKPDQLVNGLDDYLGLIAQYPAKQNVKDIGQFRISAVKHLIEYTTKKNKNGYKPHLTRPDAEAFLAEHPN